MYLRRWNSGVFKIAVSKEFSSTGPCMASLINCAHKIKNQLQHCMHHVNFKINYSLARIPFCSFSGITSICIEFQLNLS